MVVEAEIYLQKDEENYRYFTTQEFGEPLTATRQARSDLRAG